MINRLFQILSFLIFGLTSSGCTVDYLDYYQHLESPDGKFNYCLYSDVGIGDPGFYVLKLEKGINPEELPIKWSFKDGISDRDDNWIRSRTVLYNYDEASLFTSNPSIELMDNRFVVFSRGGYQMGLYDIELDNDTINFVSPWNEWYSQSTLSTNDKDKEEEEYGKWIERNLDIPIKSYIKNNQQ
ncbi:hypothetical protein [Nibribacter koreensis]|uniref:Lipoprotein n=1 Tax=Nibribacter koreensis TaxID=1084519 RepID=A0ABP8F553_9BACT